MSDLPSFTQLRERLIEELNTVTVYGTHDDDLRHFRGMVAVSYSPLMVMCHLSGLRASLARNNAASETQDHVATIVTNYSIAADEWTHPDVRQRIIAQDRW